MTVPVARQDLSFWVDTPDPLSCEPLEGEARADVAIIGGGFSGLSAAYHLIRERPDLEVILLEAQVVGCGASGRNTGILRPGVGGTILDLCRRFGPDGAGPLYRASCLAVEYVRDLIHSERIDCDLEDVPHLKMALTSRQAALLRLEAVTLARLGFEADYHDAARMAALAPIPSRGGLSYPRSGQLNPALLARGLKRRIVERGVRVHENTPVTSLTSGPEIRLTTPRGTLAAKQVVLASNAHTPQLQVLSGQIIPIQTHVSLTEPLTEAELSGLAWEGRMSLSDKRHIFNYYRLTRENRIMFGGGRPVYRPATGDAMAGATDIAEPRVWYAQRREFARTFPRLARLKITKQWSGTIGMTLDRFPIIAQLSDSPGLYFVGGWSGHGVGLATASGAIVADLLSGRPSWPSSLAWNRDRAPRLPSDPLRAVGLSVYLTGLKWGDRLEALLDRLILQRS
jgi:gamma-glutamylputrescine oxidase